MSEQYRQYLDNKHGKTFVIEATESAEGNIVKYYNPKMNITVTAPTNEPVPVTGDTVTTVITRIKPHIQPVFETIVLIVATVFILGLLYKQIA